MRAIALELKHELIGLGGVVEQGEHPADEGVLSAPFAFGRYRPSRGVRHLAQ